MNKYTFKLKVFERNPETEKTEVTVISAQLEIIQALKLESPNAMDGKLCTEEEIAKTLFGLEFATNANPHLRLHIHEIIPIS